MRMFCGIFGLYCICQLLKTVVLLLYMFIRDLNLSHISEIRWMLKFGTCNANLLLNFNEVSSIFVRKVQFWYSNKNYSEIYFKELQ